MLDEHTLMLEDDLERTKLRDTFACAALTGFLSQHGGVFNYSACAKDAYSIADAMLEARKK